jgi:fibronectin-binding autotransporter adhesin
MVTLIKKIVIIPGFVLLSMMSFSQPTIISIGNGNNVINGKPTTWSNPAGYIVQSNVTINPACTLQISAGISIQIDPSCYFDVQGCILAISTSSNNPITFTASNTYVGWEGINISNNSNYNEFNHCIIEYVKKNPLPCSTNFASCGAVYLNASDNTSFQYCTFTNNEVCSGGGIAFISSKVMINSCTFVENTVSSKGGGIYVNNGSQNSDIVSCFFANNLADFGGGIYLENCSNDIKIYLSDIQLNHAVDGAACYFKDLDCTNIPVFTDNIVSGNIASGKGGGIYIVSSIIDEISDNFFHYNEAYDGAGLYIEDSEISSFISNCIDASRASNNGAALYLKECFVYIKLVKFNANNSNNYGGGIYIDGEHSSGNSNYIINCLIADNNAENYHGGGIYTNHSFYSLNNTIAGNNAMMGIGGGIYQYNCSSTITNTVIWGNSAYISNPNAYPTPNEPDGYSYCCTPVFQTPWFTSTTDNPMFIGNGNYMISYTSSCYNAGYNSVSQHTNYDLDGNNRICHNTIDIGAYEDPYIYKSSNICTQTWNNHNPNGIDYIITDDITISPGCTLTIDPGTTIAFYGSKRMTIAPPAISPPTPAGTIYAVGNSTNYITFTATDPNSGWYGIKITTNTNTNLFGYCIFEKVIKTTGGGYDFETNGPVYLSYSNNTYFDHCIFQNNIAYHTGGGLWFMYSKANVSYCSFIDNSATNHGGGILLKMPYDANSINNISNCTFTGNITGKGGAGIWIVSAGPTNITSCTFNQNISNGSAANAGGSGIGIIVEYNGDIAIVNISQCHIIENHAYGTYGCGGGIMASNKDNYGTLELNIDGSYIQGNTANINGGGIYLRGVTNSKAIYNNLITSNTAIGNGGGIYMEYYSNPLVYSNTIVDNETENGNAGGVYFNGTCYPDFRNTIIYGNSPYDVKNNFSDPNAGDNMYHNCDFGNFTSTGNDNLINQDPVFVASNYGDYRISKAIGSGSPCIDRGDDAYVLTNVSQYDIRGSYFDRTVDVYSYTNEIDIGAYEYEDPNPSYKMAKPDSNLTINDFEDIIVYPNPTVGQFTVIIHSDIEEEINISLINPLGKTAYESIFKLKEGENKINISRGQLASGFYFMKLSSTTINSKVVKLILK